VSVCIVRLQKTVFKKFNTSLLGFGFFCIFKIIPVFQRRLNLMGFGIFMGFMFICKFEYLNVSKT